MYDQLKNMDSREIELPDTHFIRDIDSRIFQAIALHDLTNTLESKTLCPAFYSLMALKNLYSLLIQFDWTEQ